MLTVCFTAKGGQGCSTVAAMLAVLNGAVIVDTAGDMPAVLGLPDPDGPGLTDALISGSPLHDIAPHVQDNGGIALLPRGSHGADDVPGHRWSELAEVLASDARGWVLDAGTGPARTAAASADRALLVSRYCYLALRRAVHLTPRSTGLVTIREHGRSLDRHDLERLLGVPVVADLPWAPEIARAVDAGLLTDRLPRVARQALEGLADTDGRGAQDEADDQ